MRYMIAFLFSMGLSACTVQAQTAAQSLSETPLVIVTESEEIPLMVELADEPRELATGMMFRESVPEGTGMIFNFGAPREANMIMRNVSFGLDMLFLNEEGEVMAVVAHAQPYSERIINPGFPVKGVLEIGAGEAERMGIQVGDVLQHDMFGNISAAPPIANIDNDDSELVEGEN